MLAALKVSSKAAGGGGGSLVSITNQNCTALGAGTQTSTYRLESAVATKVINGVTTTLETWRLSGAAADYEVRVTDVGGALTAGTTGTWLLLSTSREWSITESGSGVSITNPITVEIRLAASPFTVLDTATVDINVFVF